MAGITASPRSLQKARLGLLDLCPQFFEVVLEPGDDLRAV